MNGLVRKATLFTAVGLVVAGAAMAGVPSPGTSIQPPVGLSGFGSVKLVGFVNPPDPSGAITYTVNDANGIPVPINTQVVLNFAACTDLALCTMHTTGGVVNCTAKTVTGLTNAMGTVTFTIVGIGLPVAPRAVNACVTVTAGGQGGFTALIASSMDRDGIPGFGAGDLAQWVSDFLPGLNPSRSDYDASGDVGAGDLSILVSLILGGLSTDSCGDCAGL